MSFSNGGAVHVALTTTALLAVPPRVTTAETRCDGRWQFGTVVGLSQDLVRLALPQAEPVGARVRLQLFLDDEFPLRLEAQVRSAIEGEDGAMVELDLAEASLSDRMLIDEWMGS